MAEKINARLRVAKIEFATPITNAAGYKTASWTQQPYTLADDEVAIRQEEGEEDPIHVHEVDAPIDVDFTAGKITLVGSFVEPSAAELKALLGDQTSEGFDFAHPSKAVALTKAIRLTTTAGKMILLPKASGFVRFDLKFDAKGGRCKYPFKFTALSASTEWPVDIAYPTGAK